jgi:serine/threonine-protein kinase
MDSASAGDCAATIRRIIVEQGLAPPEAVDAILKDWQEPCESSALAQLGRLFIKRGILSEWQWSRVQRTAEQGLAADTVPGYQLLECIGTGARGSVFKARQLHLDRLVAIKLLHPRFHEDPNFSRKLLEEAHAAARLNHPAIVQVFDVGSTGRLHYIVMEFAEGETVYQHVEQRGRYEEKQALRLIVQVAQGLSHAHERGMIHCDVKPRNIIVTPSGRPKLADFGLARSIADQSHTMGKSFGTPFYNSPEQIHGQPVDHRTDIYSLGVTFYQMVTGQLPFEGETYEQVMRQHLTQPITPPDHVNPKLSAGLGEVVEVMMAKQPDERYASMDLLLADLHALQRDLPPAHTRKGFRLDRLGELEASGRPVAAKGGRAAAVSSGPVSTRAGAAEASDGAQSKGMLIISLVINVLLILALVLLGIFYLAGG